MKMDEDEKEQLRKTVLQRMRFQSLERINNRKLEREVLQYKSKQALTSDEAHVEMESIAFNDPVLFEELSLRRSNSFKDPSRPITATVTNWNMDPTQHLTKLPGLKFCKWIADKAKVSEVVEQMETMWKEENRTKIRQKFLEQHEKNIEKERKAGVYKDYQTLSEQSKRVNVVRSRPFTTANLIRNRRMLHNNQNIQSGYTTFHNNDRKIVTAASDQPQNYKHEIFSQNDNEGEDRIISKRSDRTDGYNSQKHISEYENTKTIDRHNVEEVDEISSNDEYKDQQNNLNSDRNVIGNNMNQHDNPQMEYNDDPMNGSNQGFSRKDISEFRVSFSKPKFPVRNMTTERLAEPKKPFKVNNPFLYSD